MSGIKRKTTLSNADLAANFREAVFAKNYRRMKEIMQLKNFDVNLQCNGKHIMYDVIESGNIAAAKMIIDHGSVDLSIQDGIGYSLREYAVELNMKPIVRMFERQT